MIDAIVAALALLGLAVSWTIYAARKAGKPLRCWYDKDCNKVFRSQYSRLLGIPNEEIGLLYYAVIAAASLLHFAFGGLIDPALYGRIMLGATTVAMVFSLVLFYVQVAVLRTICEYCVAGMIFTACIWLVLQA